MTSSSSISSRSPAVGCLIRCSLCIAFLLLGAGMSASAAADTNRVYDPYFFGFETDPAMDFGGRDVVTVHSVVNRSLGRVLRTDRHPFLAPIHEFFFAAGLSTFQHEVFGHGSRAREFDLDPEYSFGFDFSGGTGLNRDPESNLQNIVLAGGGTEGDSVMAHQILLDLYSGDGTDGSKIPLMAIAKLDFSLYCLITPDPTDSSGDFEDAYEDGNDIAYYGVARQAQRRGADPADVWNNDYVIDFNDAQLSDNYDDLQAAAVWNLIDPAALAAMYGYVADHVRHGATQVRPPVIPLGGGLGLTAGTRAFLGPSEVTRFLDLYLVTPGPLMTMYVRDLQSSVDQAYGFGAGVHKLPLGGSVTLAAGGDYWQTPEADEGLYDGTGWNASGEVGVMVTRHFGVVGKVGGKSDGYFPGTPMESGVYGGAGVQVAF